MAQYDREAPEPLLTADPDAMARPSHALFPRHADEPETRDICTLQILRWDADGNKETCPKRYPASEVTDWDWIVERFGGGWYQVIAFDRLNRFVAYTPGQHREECFYSAEPPKPFRQGRPTQKQPASTAAAAPAPPPQAPPPASSSGSDVSMRDVLMMQIENSKAMFTMMSTIVTAVLGQKAQQPAVSPTEMFNSLVGAAKELRPPAAGGAVQSLRETVSVLKEFNGGSLGGGDEIKDVMQIMQPFLQKSAEGPAAPTQPPAPTAALVAVYMPGVGLVYVPPEHAPSVAARASQAAAASPSAPAAQPQTATQPPPAPPVRRAEVAPSHAAPARAERSEEPRHGAQEPNPALPNLEPELRELDALDHGDASAPGDTAAGRSEPRGPQAETSAPPVAGPAREAPASPGAPAAAAAATPAAAAPAPAGQMERLPAVLDEADWRAALQDPEVRAELEKQIGKDGVAELLRRVAP